MSNQTKIGLLLGLGVVLLVGIIVSDHLATQSQNHITEAGPVVATIGDINPTNQRPDIRSNFLAQAPTPSYETELANPQTAMGTQLPSVQIISPMPQPVMQPGISPMATATMPQLTVAVAAPAQLPPPAQLVQAPAAAPPATAVAIAPQPAPQKAQRTYTIKEGDTLSSIAAATLGSRNRWKDILDANASTLGAAKNLKIGTAILIPETEAKMAPAPVTASLVPPPVKPALPPAAKPRTYTVAKGDLLGSIAARTLGSIKKTKELVAANRKALPQGEKTVLHTGMVLTIPAQ